MNFKKYFLLITILILSNSIFACSAGIEFLISVSPQYVDQGFFQKFAEFAQKTDDMAYYMINRNKILAIEKYDKAYSILYTIYNTYFNNPPPFYTNKKIFQKKLDSFTKKFSDLKELLDNSMFATSSETLKKFVADINKFINPGYSWKPLSEKRQSEFNHSHLEDLSYALQSILDIFNNKKSGENTKIKIGKIEYKNKNVFNNKFLQEFKPTFSKIFSKYFTTECSSISFSDLIIDDNLKQNLMKKNDYIIFGEIMTPETVFLKYIDEKSKMKKEEISSQAFLRYKILNIKNLSIETLDEIKFGIKTSILYDKTGKKIVSSHRTSYSTSAMKLPEKTVNMIVKKQKNNLK